MNEEMIPKSFAVGAVEAALRENGNREVEAVLNSLLRTIEAGPNAKPCECAAAA